MEENEIILESCKSSSVKQSGTINNNNNNNMLLDNGNKVSNQNQMEQIDKNVIRKQSKQYENMENKYDDEIEILDDEDVELEEDIQDENNIQYNFETDHNNNVNNNDNIEKGTTQPLDIQIQNNINKEQLYEFDSESHDMKNLSYQNQDQIQNNQNNQNTFQETNVNKKEFITTKTQIDQNTKYNNSFFKNIEKHKTGFPTMTNKKRNIPDFLTPDQYEEQQKDKSLNNASNQQDRKGNKRMNQQLIIEMENIENHQKYRSRIEQFLIEFTKKPATGIQYAINNDLCNDDPYDIANFILSLDGINKYQLGQYFGSNKQQNQKVMQAYFRLMDFQKVKFDQAIRQLLARFRLPGEADQIDRIVTQFGIVYRRDNPDVFQHEDVPYILTYAAIMLNVDAHNDQIEQKRKMKKENFVSNNLSCLSKPDYHFQDRKFLEDLYDNVTKNKFETKADDFEKGLEKIMAIYSKQDSKLMQVNLDKIKLKLQNTNHNYLKYGRAGRPHARNVYLDDKCENICWSDSKNKQDKPRSMAVRDVIDFAIGSKTTEVFQKNNIPIEFDDLCFSIISKSRTLDLQIPDKEIKYDWCQFLFQTLCQKREAMTEHITKKRQKQINKIQLDEVWRNDIFPNWEYHWDYQIDKPKNFIESKKKSQFEKICPCIINWKKTQLDKKLQHASTNHPQYDDQLMDNQRQQSQNGQLLDNYQKSQKNKSFLLISLWKLGIPNWSRPTIWPLAIGNRLEISDSLYDILKKQVENTLELNKIQEINSDNKDNIQSIIQQFEDIKFDLNKLQPFKSNNADQSALKISFKQQKRQIQNILCAFIFYRPDVGYVKNSMVKIVYMLIQYLDEQTAFVCLVNLLHSYHFLSFFKGDMKEIEWRVKFFDQQLQQKMPLVYNHFKAIDLSTEVYLMHWFLSLFSNSLNDLEFLSRIWDNFLLEGEIFAYKIAMAFINFFQLELKMSPFDRALSILKNISDQVTPEYLFEIIEQIDLSWQEYQTNLQNQKISQLNAHINKALLL